MTIENIKQIISFLRAAEYTYNHTYYNDYTHSPRPTYNFLIMKEGEANLVIDEQTFKIEKNNVVWIPKNSKYSVEWKGSPVLFSVLHFDFAASFDPFFYTKTTIQHLNYADIENLLRDFNYLKENGIETYMSLSVFYRIFSLLYPLIGKSEYEHEEQQSIQPAIDYIESHYREKIQVQILSELCFISQSRFEHLFKKIMGVSPITYKNTILIQHVQRALISDKSTSIQSISDIYGFESTVYFCRLFKTITGVTPTQYRKMNALI